MKPIATNIADFETLRKEGLVYVDKTAYLHKMISTKGSTFFFCARPRRFGKSLSVTTLKSIFLGHREYFEDLAIAKTDWEWKKHTVIHFNWGGVSVTNLAEFKRTLALSVYDSLSDAGFAYDENIPPSGNLSRAIRYFYEQDGIGPAILIDEYDDPVAKTLHKVELAEQIRTELSAIYAQFKDNSDKIRFLYITGVSKFTKLSIFSCLSSLNDISFDKNYAALYGYTEKELTDNFEEHLRVKAELMKLDYEAFREKLKFWFNGYRFARVNSETVYNPVSISLTLTSEDPFLTATWTATGRPSMLMNFIKREGLLAIDYEKGVKVRDQDFDVSDIAHLRAVPMLYQAGYLTIKDFDDGRFLLGIPDEEVRRDLMMLVAAQIAKESEYWVNRLADHLIDCEFDEFFEGLKSLYAGMPYGSREGSVHEGSYQRVLKAFLQALGLECASEVAYAASRSDIVAKDRHNIWIFELKVDKTAADAMRQIHEKDYAAPYRAEGLPIWGIALCFNSKTRQLADFDVEKL